MDKWSDLTLKERSAPSEHIGSTGTLLPTRFGAGHVGKRDLEAGL